MRRGFAPRPLMDRFWEKVEFTDTCWLWTAGLTQGYGHFATCGRKMRRAHRIAYEYFNEPIPQGLTLDHLCRVRRCVNPDHLEIVTAGENVRRGTPFRPKPLVCPHGHQYTSLTIYTDFKGRQRCKPCIADTQRRYRAKAS